MKGEYATAPFLHTTEAVGLPVVARLKENLPLLAAAVRTRFDGQPPQAVFQEGDDRVEVWDADDFDPWDTFKWPTVRTLRYRQHKLAWSDTAPRPAVAQRPTGTLPPQPFKSAPLRRLPPRRTSETAVTPRGTLPFQL